MSYQFSDAYSSVLTAAANTVGGALQPVIQVSSVAGQVAVTQSGTWNISSVVGAFTPYAQPGSFVNGVSSVVTGTTAASVLSAPGANLRNYITQIKVTNASATGAVVNIKDSGANVLDTGYAAASGGGWSSTFPTPIKQLTTNASIDVVSLTQASILAQISGYIGA
jgi:hypothetical protein